MVAGRAVGLELAQQLEWLGRTVPVEMGLEL